MGNEPWSDAKVLPFFRQCERALDIRDDFHGTDGPRPVRRRQARPVADIPQAFHDACVQLAYRIIADTNGANPAGIGVWPSNNLAGWRMSAAITPLHPQRHRLNRTVRGNVFVRWVVCAETKAVGVEVASGGELFTVEAARVVWSAGALKSPHILMLSGIGQQAQLAQFGLPLVHELPGVGENLWNHLAAQITFKVKDGKSLVTGIDTARYSLHYTSAGSEEVNDMLLRPPPVVDERPERVHGVRTQPLTGDVPAERVARISGTLGLLEGAGYVRLAWADPTVQPTVHDRYLHHPNDQRRVRDGIRMAAALLHSDAYKDVAEYRIQPTADVLANDDALDLYSRKTVGTARHVAGTYKMGSDAAPMAVVDQYGNVQGVQGLAVVDASIMPRIPRSGGCHATVLMMGERAVAFIEAALRQPTRV